FHQSVGELVGGDGDGVLNLVRGEELALVRSEPAVGAVAGGFAFDSRSRRNFEVPQAVHVWALPAKVAVRVGWYGYANPFAGVFEKTHALFSSITPTADRTTPLNH